MLDRQRRVQRQGPHGHLASGRQGHQGRRRQAEGRSDAHGGGGRDRAGAGRRVPAARNISPRRQARATPSRTVALPTTRSSPRAPISVSSAWRRARPSSRSPYSVTTCPSTRPTSSGRLPIEKNPSAIVRMSLLAPGDRGMGVRVRAEEPLRMRGRNRRAQSQHRRHPRRRALQDHQDRAAVRDLRRRAHHARAEPARRARGAAPAHGRLPASRARWSSTCTGPAFEADAQKRRAAARAPSRAPTSAMLGSEAASRRRRRSPACGATSTASTRCASRPSPTGRASAWAAAYFGMRIADTHHGHQALCHDRARPLQSGTEMRGWDERCRRPDRKFEWIWRRPYLLLARLRVAAVVGGACAAARARRTSAGNLKAATKRWPWRWRA